MLFSATVVALALAFIGGAFIYPFVRSKLSQRRAVKMLLKDAVSMGYKYKKFYKNIFSVRNLSYRYDLLVYSDKTTYAVKLWGAKHIMSDLILTDGGRVLERRKASPVMNMSKGGNAHIEAGRNAFHPKGN